MNSKFLDYTALVLTIVGAVNWGLIGFFRFNLVTFLFGDMTWLSRIIYALVGISGLYLLSLFGRIIGLDFQTAAFKPEKPPHRELYDGLSSFVSFFMLKLYLSYALVNRLYLWRC